jgi:hypothetical protein
MATLAGGFFFCGKLHYPANIRRLDMATSKNPKDKTGNKKPVKK